MNKKSLILESAVQGNISIANRNNDSIRFIAVLQEANKPNRNGRIYPKEHIDAALKHPIIQEKLRTKTWFMEVGHPMTQDIMRQRTPDLNNVCCIIEDYWWEGNTLKAHCQTTKTRCGYDMKGLLEQGCQLSFSMRGTGDVVDDPRTGQKIVGSNLQITTYDWVWLPSHPEAYMDSLCESTQTLMFNINQYSNRNVALCESMDLFENGAVIDLEANTPELKSYDYSKKYYQKYKKLCESYQYSAGDKVVGLSENKLTVKLHNEEEFADKIVMIEDYVIKSTRSQLSAIISEASDPAVVKLDDEDKTPVHETAKEADLEDSVPTEEEILGTEVDADDVETDELEYLSDEELSEAIINMSNNNIAMLLYECGDDISDANIKYLRENISTLILDEGFKDAIKKGLKKVSNGAKILGLSAGLVGAAGLGVHNLNKTAEDWDKDTQKIAHVQTAEEKEDAKRERIKNGAINTGNTLTGLGAAGAAAVAGATHAAKKAREKEETEDEKVTNESIDDILASLRNI